MRAYIIDNVLDCDISYRGGTLKVNVSELFPNVDDPIMGAYQNYLGGGIAGAIVGASLFDPEELNVKDKKLFFMLKDEIKRYFYDLNNGGGDDYMQENVTGKETKGGYEKLQKMPVSGY